jgi:hypothetical protein
MSKRHVKLFKNGRNQAFRANSSCLDRTQLSEKKDSGPLSRRLRPSRFWQFLQPSRLSMTIFRRSNILPAEGSPLNPIDARASGERDSAPAWNSNKPTNAGR